jgi:hypothetical protein
MAAADVAERAEREPSDSAREFLKMFEHAA